MKKKVKKKGKKIKEIGQSQMIAPSGPEYSTTGGHHHLESYNRYVKMNEDLELEMSNYISLLEVSKISNDYKKQPPYNGYEIVVGKHPIPPESQPPPGISVGQYVAIGTFMGTRTIKRAGAESPSAALLKLKELIDHETANLPKVEKNSYLAFNAAFTREILGISTIEDVTIHLMMKLGPGPTLIIASTNNVKYYSDILKSEGFKNVHNRNVKNGMVSASFSPFMHVPHENGVAAGLIAHARYVVDPSPTYDRDGNSVYKCHFHSIARHDERVILGPGFNVIYERTNTLESLNEDFKFQYLKYEDALKKPKPSLKIYDPNAPIERIEIPLSMKNESVKMDPDKELAEIKRLAGIGLNNIQSETIKSNHLNAAEKAKLMKENNIKPGTEAWFKLWFSRPELTGEKPI